MFKGFYTILHTPTSITRFIYLCPFNVLGVFLYKEKKNTTQFDFICTRVALSILNEETYILVFLINDIATDHNIVNSRPDPISVTIPRHWSYRLALGGP